MTKHPDTPLQIAHDFTEDAKNIFGDDLVALFLYGSAARGAWYQGKSDINFLIVLTEVGMASLNAAFPLVEKWRKRTRALPLFMTRQYISASLDSFPVEFLHMQRHYRCLYGEDLLATLEIPRASLRLQCEQEIKGKLLHLREVYLATLGKRHHLHQFINLTLPAFAVLFKALLFLKGEEIPAEHAAILMRTAECYGLDADLFQKLLQAGDRKAKWTHVELNRLASAYISEINKLTMIIDQME